MAISSMAGFTASMPMGYARSYPTLLNVPYGYGYSASPGGVIPIAGS